MPETNNTPTVPESEKKQTESKSVLHDAHVQEYHQQTAKVFQQLEKSPESKIVREICLSFLRTYSANGTDLEQAARAASLEAAAREPLQRVFERVAEIIEDSLDRRVAEIRDNRRPINDGSIDARNQWRRSGSQERMLFALEQIFEHAGHAIPQEIISIFNPIIEPIAKANEQEHR